MMVAGRFKASLNNKFSCCYKSLLAPLGGLPCGTVAIKCIFLVRSTIGVDHRLCTLPPCFRLPRRFGSRSSRVLQSSNIVCRTFPAAPHLPSSTIRTSRSARLAVRVRARLIKLAGLTQCARASDPSRTVAVIVSMRICMVAYPLNRPTYCMERFSRLV